MPKTLTIDRPKSQSIKTPSPQTQTRCRRHAQLVGRSLSPQTKRLAQLEALDQDLLKMLHSLGVVFGELHMINNAKCKGCHGSRQDRAELLAEHMVMDATADTEASALAPKQSSSKRSAKELLQDISQGVKKNAEQVEQIHHLMHLLHKEACGDCQKRLEERSEWYKFSMLI